jgi:hypothetical protein
MAKERPNVPTKLKEELRREAGGKCANPGCAARRAHLHHIREWHVYETHDGAHMVAVCPNCHDAIHHGEVEITDETIHRWKGIKRTNQTIRDQIYVEPSATPRLRLGTLDVIGEGGVAFFDLGASNTLSFRIVEEDIFFLNLGITTTDRREVLRVTENDVRHEPEEGVDYAHVPGRVVVTAPLNERFLPTWALKPLREHEPEFARDGRVPVLDIEVLEPGLVQVKGVWNARGHVIVITENMISFVRPLGAWSFRTALEDESCAVIRHNGPINLFTLRFGEGALFIPSGAPKVGRNDPCWCGSDMKYKKCHGS